MPPPSSRSALASLVDARSVAASRLRPAAGSLACYLPRLARPAFSLRLLAGRAPLSRPAPRWCFGFCAPPFAFVAATRSPSPFARLRRVGGAPTRGGSPAPAPPRAGAHRPLAGGALPAGYRSQSQMHHRVVFGRWPCSPLGLRSPLPALVHRGFPLGRCRACPRSTIALRSSLSALPRVLLLLLLPSRARWARGAAGVGWRGPPASLRPLRVRSRASLRSPAPCRPAYGTVLRTPSRPAVGCPSLGSGQRVRQVAR